MPNIYVLSKDSHPMMPCHHYGRVKRWLKQGKVVIKQYKPFVVQLRYDVEMEHSEGMVLGIDPGRTNIGLCAVDKQGKVMFSAQVVGLWLRHVCPSKKEPFCSTKHWLSYLLTDRRERRSAPRLASGFPRRENLWPERKLSKLLCPTRRSLWQNASRHSIRCLRT